MFGSTRFLALEISQIFVCLGGMARFLQQNYLCVSSEGSDQNFIDEEVEDMEGSGESRRRRSNKRLKSADDTMDDQVSERFVFTF